MKHTKNGYWDAENIYILVFLEKKRLNLFEKSEKLLLTRFDDQRNCPNSFEAAPRYEQFHI